MTTQLKAPIKVEDVPQHQLINRRRKHRQEILKVLNEKAAVTEQATKDFLIFHNNQK